MCRRPKALRREVSSGYYVPEEGPLVETSIFPLSFLVVQEPVYLSHAINVIDCNVNWACSATHDISFKYDSRVAHSHKFTEVSLNTGGYFGLGRRHRCIVYTSC